MGSAVLPHLQNGWQVDQAILNEEDRLVVIRFGRDWDPSCMKQDVRTHHPQHILNQCVY